MSALAVSRAFPASALRFLEKGTEFVLRPPRVTDAADFVAALDESAAELKRFMPWAHVPQTLEGQIARIRAGVTPGLEGRDFPMGLFSAEGRLLVVAALHARCPLNPDGLEIGYWTRSGEAGRGLATLASRLLIVYAFEALGADRIQISHNEENVASRKVIEKCGFVPEGVSRNHVAAPTPAQLAGGLSACRRHPIYSLVPEDRAALAWYPRVRDEVRVVDQLGEERGALWRRT